MVRMLHFLIWRSEFESCCSIQFFCKIVVEKTESKQTEVGVLAFLRSCNLYNEGLKFLWCVLLVQIWLNLFLSGFCLLWLISFGCLVCLACHFIFCHFSGQTGFSVKSLIYSLPMRRGFINYLYSTTVWPAVRQGGPGFVWIVWFCLVLSDVSGLSDICLVLFGSSGLCDFVWF